MDTPGRHEFEAVWSRADAIPGWLTRDQAASLWNAASSVPESGTVLEIGSHLGRSALVLASARRGRLVAVDPFPAEWRYGQPGTREHFEANLAAAGVRDRVDLRVARSTDLRRSWTEPIDLLYIDGKHDARTVSDDLRWSSYVRDGGVVLVHDAFSSLGVTVGLLWRVLPRRDLRYIGRVGSLARFERARPDTASRRRFLAQLPWWVRNLVVKVLLRLRLTLLARLLGHHDTADPY